MTPEADESESLEVGGGRGASRRALRVDVFLEREREGTALGVLADRPFRPRMDDGPTQRFDLLECRLDVIDRDIRQRKRIAGTAATLVNTDGRVVVPRLPARTLLLGPRHQGASEELRPEPPRALRIIRGKLDQGQATNHEQTIVAPMVGC